MYTEIYEIIKDIPLQGGGTIKKGRQVQKTNGVYYLDGGMLPPDYQKDFDELVNAERVTGWKYLVPLKTKTLWSNNKEG